MANTEAGGVFSDLARCYGFKIRSVHSCRTIYKSEAAFRAETERGDLLIKPYTGPVRRLRRNAAYLRRLRRYGFHQMPKWLKTSAGSRLLSLDGKLYYVTEWIHGGRLDSTEADLRALGKTLGKLHTISRGLGLNPPSYTLRTFLLARHRKYLRQLASVREMDTETGRWFREKGEEIDTLFRDAFRILNRSHAKKILQREHRKPPLIHGDITYANVLKADGRVYLIDWDFMDRGSGYYDLVKALTNTAGFSPARLAAFLKGYEQKRQLSRTEKRIVSALYRIPREAWHACGKAYLGKTTNLQSVVRSSWSERIQAIDWMDAWSRA